MKNIIHEMEYENLHKSNQLFFSEFRRTFSATLKSGWYILGKNGEKFQNDFAKYCGVDHCIGVNSGLDAITLSLQAFDFEAGSEVLVPANTYIASILSIIHANLTPVLVEPDIATYNIDSAKIEVKITKRTKAILVVHLYGKL